MRLDSLNFNFKTIPFWTLTALALAASSLSTKAAGLAWLLMLLAGLWHALASPGAAAMRPAHLEDRRTAGVWLIFCTAGLILMLIPTAYWGGPWPERHAQWRLFAGAIGLYGLLRHPNPSLRAGLPRLASGLAVALVLSLGLVVWQGSNSAPTNRIPWMAGLTLIGCVLPAMAYGLQDVSLRQRRLWLTASALAVLTALLSGVRGSWGLAVVWPVLLWLLHRSNRGVLPRPPWWLWAGLMAVVLLAAQRLPTADLPWQRLRLALQESQQSQHTQVYASSTGARLALLEIGLQVVREGHPMGLGHQAHKERLREGLREKGAPEFAEVLGHYHSDWLNPWSEFGWMGLLGYLSYAAGLLFIAWRMQQQGQHASALGTAAVLLMHMSTGLTNTNFAHNYYPTLLSLSVCLLVCTAHAQGLREKLQHPISAD